MIKSEKIHFMSETTTTYRNYPIYKEYIIKLIDPF